MQVSVDDFEQLRKLEESWWVRTSALHKTGWQLRFHQGTPLPSMK